MCHILNVSRSGYYKCRDEENVSAQDEYTDLVVKIFNENLIVFGTRKIKKACAELGIVLSRRRIGRIMALQGLVSSYTVVQFKPMKQGVNRDEIQNVVNRGFDGREQHEVIVSDLTYVRVNGRWNYMCILVDLYNREIVGYSAGKNTNARLVNEAFVSVKSNLNHIKFFHSDRGLEFKNRTIESILNTFGITRSSSNPGVPYDNAVAEATLKSIKTEFIHKKNFENVEQLRRELSAYIWWFNNKRYHQTLNYLTPVQYRLEKVI